jgi:hypothetical protein
MKRAVEMDPGDTIYNTVTCLMIRHGVWIGNWTYLTPTNREYN